MAQGPGGKAPNKTLKIFGRVQGPTGKRLGPTKILVIPWILGEWEQPIPDSPPGMQTFLSDAAGRFVFQAPSGGLLRVFARNGGAGLVSAVRPRVAPGQALKLNLFPASRLILPPASLQAFSWVLLGMDRESHRPFLLDWGIQKKGRPEKALLLPPGHFELRMIRSDSASATLSLTLSPREEKRLRPFWETPAIVFPPPPGSQQKPLLLLPPLFSPPSGNRIPLSPGGQPVPTLHGMVLRSWIRVAPGSLRALDLGPLVPGEKKVLDLPAPGARSLLIRPPSSSKQTSSQVNLLWWDLGRKVRRHLSLPKGRPLEVQGIPPHTPLVLIYEERGGGVSYLSAPPGPKSFSLQPSPKPSSGLDLRLFSPDGMPAGSSPVQLFPLELPGLSPKALALLGPWRRWTNPLGRLHLRGLPEGDYRLHVLPGLHSELNLKLHLSPGKIQALTLRLTTGFHLEGRILDSRGEPVPGAVVKLSSERLPPTISPRRTTTDSKGRFRFLSLGEGPFSLEAILVRGSRTFFARRRGISLEGKQTVLVLKSEDPRNPFKKENRRE